MGIGQAEQQISALQAQNVALRRALLEHEKEEGFFCHIHSCSKCNASPAAAQFNGVVEDVQQVVSKVLDNVKEMLD